MNKSGPITVIEDDMDDQEMLVEIFNKLGYPNKIRYFTDGNKALAYLNESDSHPFLILSDINMPKINGFELRNKVLPTNNSRQSVFPTYFLQPPQIENQLLTLMRYPFRDFLKNQPLWKAWNRLLKKL